MSRIAFLHPDLGIGGAERLIIDCALALKNCGHSIHLFTNHHDPSHCFIETKNGQLLVSSIGDWLPKSCFGKMKAFWAYLRMIYLTIYFLIFFRKKFDLIICDQISSGLPFLNFFQIKTLFYCHFPDQLLTKRQTFLKKIYRKPLDWFEELTISYADIILVNSKFTGEIFYQTFKSLTNINLNVLYPSVNFTSFDDDNNDNENEEENLIIELIPKNIETIFLSINRFERKKNLSLAIEAFAQLFQLEENFNKNIHLIIAGGYDLKNEENLQYFQELNLLAKKFQLTSSSSSSITFLRDITDQQKKFLLKKSTACIYTPENEHFGIVPLEAMYMQCPVIATDSGGPRETIIHQKTGFLCEPNPESFSRMMFKFVQDKNLSKKMGSEGRRHVLKNFNFETFQTNLNRIVTRLINSNQ